MIKIVASLGIAESILPVAVPSPADAGEGSEEMPEPLMNVSVVSPGQPSLTTCRFWMGELQGEAEVIHIAVVERGRFYEPLRVSTGQA
jgi:hypothetical protein